MSRDGLIVTPMNELSWQEIHSDIRALSNAALHRITFIANVAAWPVLRVALYAYALQCQEVDDINQFYRNAMREMDVKQTLVKMIIGADDKQEYINTFKDISVPSNAAFLYLTQFFVKGAYSGAWLTYQYADEMGEIQLGYVGITPDWTTVPLATRTELYRWTALMANAPYIFWVYAISANWPRILVGERDA